MCFCNNFFGGCCRRCRNDDCDNRRCRCRRDNDDCDDDNDRDDDRDRRRRRCHRCCERRFG